MSSKHLSQYFRERIVRLWMNGSSDASIVSTMTDEGKSVPAVTVRKWIFRWEKNNSLENHYRSGRPSTITSEIAFMDNSLDEDDELPSSELRRLIVRKFGVSLLSPTIRRYLRKNLEWVVIRTRPGPMISSANKVKRLEFARMCLSTDDDLGNVIWTDESSIQLKRHCQTMRVKVQREREYKPVPKHAVKVHVWAGISMLGARRICIFDKIMDASLYVNILEDFLLPFLEETFPTKTYHFMQDNDPKHTSRLAKAFYEEKGINWWPTPASSPDINLMERVWNELKYYIARYVKPLTKDELVQGIKTFWKERMTQEKCARYIAHTHVVLPKVIMAEGRVTGE